MKESDIKRIEAIMCDYCVWLEHLWEIGTPLGEISQLSYNVREKGDENSLLVPYMSILTKTRTGGVSDLDAAPTRKQKELYDFFAIKYKEGSMIPRYRLYVDLGGVHFSKRLGTHDLVELFEQA